MKTYQHALISLGYAAAVSLLAGKGITDPWIYLSAVIGGEAIDFIDHPLYHLVYNRNEPHVVEARKLFLKGKWKQAATYLNMVEDERQFKGLWLHNVYSLLIVSIIAVLASIFLPGKIFPFIFVGAFLLHMITDIYGDFKKLGNFDNWLWVLSPKILTYLGGLKTRLLWLILLLGTFIQVSFFIVSFRWGWQLANVYSERSLFTEAQLSWQSWLVYIPLLFLFAYFLSMLTLCAAGVHKYRLERVKNGRKDPVKLKLDSLKLLRKYLKGELPKTRQHLELVLLRIQADVAFWTIVLASLIVVSLTTITLLNLDTITAIILIPIFLALFFGTLVHTTVGEIGGVLGVLLSWVLNIIMARMGFFNHQPWDLSYGYYLFGAAIGAWILGLLGGLFLRGQSRMSLVAFSLRITPKSPKISNQWITPIKEIAFSSLEEGYSQTSRKLYPANRSQRRVVPPHAELVYAPYGGTPVIGSNYYHIQATDHYAPVLRDLCYTLCDNQLSSALEEKNLFLPVFPRYRLASRDASDVDMALENGGYRWLRSGQELILETPSDYYDSFGCKWGLVKTWGEFLDHMVTRASTFQTDMFVYPDKSDKVDSVLVCGIVREYTSTKEYATVEAEAYAAAVYKAMTQKIQSSKDLQTIQSASARLIYPRVSMYDQELISWCENNMTLPSDTGSFTKDDQDLIQRSLTTLPVKKYISNISSSFRHKVIVLGIEYVAILIVSAMKTDIPLLTTIIEIIRKLLE